MSSHLVAVVDDDGSAERAPTRPGHVTLPLATRLSPNVALQPQRAPSTQRNPEKLQRGQGLRLDTGLGNVTARALLAMPR